MRYILSVLLYTKPRLVSNNSQASVGSQIHGSVESMNVKTGDDSRVEEVPLANTEVMDCRPTTRSRAESPARLNVRLFGVYLERSDPPRVKLPKMPVDPEDDQPLCCL